jgi:hypothetical protein
LKGGLNSARLPWQVRVNVRVDKDINFKIGSGTGDKAKMATMTIYLQILNALDMRNVLGVYGYTGDPSDDGWLSSAIGQQAVSNALNAMSYTDLYSISVQDPGNYSLPRRTRLGIRFTF